MWEFGIPDARPETLRYADSVEKSSFMADSFAERGERVNALKSCTSFTARRAA
jgi:hypothetical protein